MTSPPLPPRTRPHVLVLPGCLSPCVGAAGGFVSLHPPPSFVPVCWCCVCLLLQVFLVLIVFASVPIMLLVKPLILKREHKQAVARAAAGASTPSRPPLSAAAATACVCVNTCGSCCSGWCIHDTTPAEFGGAAQHVGRPHPPPPLPCLGLLCLRACTAAAAGHHGGAGAGTLAHGHEDEEADGGHGHGGGGGHGHGDGEFQFGEIMIHQVRRLCSPRAVSAACPVFFGRRCAPVCVRPCVCARSGRCGDT
jgi:hypothetical protein